MKLGFLNISSLGADWSGCEWSLSLCDFHAGILSSVEGVVELLRKCQNDVAVLTYPKLPVVPVVFVNGGTISLS